MNTVVPAGFQTDCPWCSPGWSHFRLGWNLAGLYANCWACGRVDAAKTLGYATGSADLAGLRGFFRAVEREAPPEEVKRGKLVEPPGLGPLLTAHRRYLKGRGFDPDELERVWGLRGIGWDGGMFAWSVYIPVVFRGEVVSWTTRSLKEGHHRRYRSASPREEAIDHKTLLFGEDMVKNTIVVTEGPFDAMAVGPGAVCTFGAAFKRAQVRRIARYPVRVVCFDADDEGRRKGEELASLLEPFPGSTHLVKLEAGKDLAESRLTVSKRIRDTFLD